MKKRKKDTTIYPEPTEWIPAYEYNRLLALHLKEEFEKIRGKPGCPDSFSNYVGWSHETTKAFASNLRLSGIAVDWRRKYASHDKPEKDREENK
jgi:hypothetical protein